MQRRNGLCARLVAEYEDVVAFRVRRPEANHGSGAEPALLSDLAQHRLRIIEQRARRLPDGGVVQDRWILADELPGRKERRPVDEGPKLLDRIVREHLGAEEGRPRRQLVARPVELERIRSRALEREPLLVLLSARMRGGDAGIFVADVGDVTGPG